MRFALLSIRSCNRTQKWKFYKYLAESWYVVRTYIRKARAISKGTYPVPTVREVLVSIRARPQWLLQKAVPQSFVSVHNFSRGVKPFIATRALAPQGIPQKRKTTFSAAPLAASVLLVFLLPAAAQIKIGDNVQLTGTGNVSAGYSDNWGNQIGSQHGFNFGGVGTIGGYYYSPNFLSFNITPYYNQNWANSNFQTVTDATGIALSSSIFAGSRFPGSVSYSADFNKESNYTIPGAQNYITNGSGQGLGIGWGVNLPDWPSLSIGYSYGTSNYSVYGTNQGGSNDFNNFYVHSSYRWEDFSLAGGFNLSNSNAQIPQIFSNGL